MIERNLLLQPDALLAGQTVEQLVLARGLLEDSNFTAASLVEQECEGGPAGWAGRDPAGLVSHLSASNFIFAYLTQICTTLAACPSPPRLGHGLVATQVSRASRTVDNSEHRRPETRPSGSARTRPPPSPWGTAATPPC